MHKSKGKSEKAKCRFRKWSDTGTLHDNADAFINYN